MANVFFNTYKGKDGNDWTAGAASAYKCMLVDGNYTPNVDDDFPADGAATHELTGGGYARQNVANRTRAVSDTADDVDHGADNVTFTNVTGSPRWAVIYRAVGSDADHQLVCAIDLGAGITLAGNTFVVRWNGGSSNGTIFRGT